MSKKAQREVPEEMQGERTTAAESVDLRKYRIIKTVLLIAALAAIVLAIVFLYRFQKSRLSDPQKKVIQENNAKVGTALYSILLEGKHTAKGSSGKEVQFSFTKGFFEGYTTLKDRDMGSYEIRYDDSGKSVLMISGEVVTDEYYIETDGETITLEDTATGEVFTFSI